MLWDEDKLVEWLRTNRHGLAERLRDDDAARERLVVELHRALGIAERGRPSAALEMVLTALGEIDAFREFLTSEEFASFRPRQTNLKDNDHLLSDIVEAIHGIVNEFHASESAGPKPEKKPAAAADSKGTAPRGVRA
jgi:hypothetical protein